MRSLLLPFPWTIGHWLSGWLVCAVRWIRRGSRWWLWRDMQCTVWGEKRDKTGRGGQFCWIFGNYLSGRFDIHCILRMILRVAGHRHARLSIGITLWECSCWELAGGVDEIVVVVVVVVIAVEVAVEFVVFVDLFVVVVVVDFVVVEPVLVVAGDVD